MSAGTLPLELPTATRSAALTRTRMRWFTSLGVLGAVAGGALAYSATPLLPTRYTAQAQMVMSDPGATVAVGASGRVNVTTDPLLVAQVLRSDEVARETSSQLEGRLTAEQVMDRVTVSTDADAPVIRIDVTAETADLARDLAATVPDAYIAVEAAGFQERADQTEAVLVELRAVKETRLQAVQTEMATRTSAAYEAASQYFLDPGVRAAYVRATLETDVGFQQLQNEAAALIDSINATTDAIEQSDVSFQILQSGVDQVLGARLPTSPTSPVTERNVLIGVAVGALFGAAVAWWATDRRRLVEAQCHLA